MGDFLRGAKQNFLGGANSLGGRKFEDVSLLPSYHMYIA